MCCKNVVYNYFIFIFSVIISVSPLPPLPSSHPHSPQIMWSGGCVHTVPYTYSIYGYYFVSFEGKGRKFQRGLLQFRSAVKRRRGGEKEGESRCTVLWWNGLKSHSDAPSTRERNRTSMTPTDNLFNFRERGERESERQKLPHKSSTCTPLHV